MKMYKKIKNVTHGHAQTRCCLVGRMMLGFSAVGVESPPLDRFEVIWLLADGLDVVGFETPLSFLVPLLDGVGSSPDEGVTWLREAPVLGMTKILRESEIGTKFKKTINWAGQIWMQRRFLKFQSDAENIWGSR